MLTTCCLALVCLVVPDSDPSRMGSPRLVEPDNVLDQMLKEFLFDPIGAQRVRVQTTVRTLARTQLRVEREGWLVAAKENRPASIFFADGESIPAPALNTITDVDFVAECRQRYAIAPTVRGRHRFWLDRGAPEVRAGFDLMLAAWLRQLGEDELAAKALDRAAGEGQTLAQLRQELARKAYADLIFAYEAYSDEEAVLHAARLFRLYAPEARRFAQAQQLSDELSHRGRNGTLGTVGEFSEPKEYAAWDDPKKIAFLIDALPEIRTNWRMERDVQGKNWKQPFPSLVSFGERAIPFLIDVIENNDRLTREVVADDRGMELATEPQVVTVREVALGALQVNLRVRTFQAASAEKVATGNAEKIKKAVVELRTYWKQYGKLPFAERMLKVLTEPTTNFEMTREAAWNLGTLSGTRLSIGTYFVRIGHQSEPLLRYLWQRSWDGSYITDAWLTEPAAINPAISQENPPVVAEAILQAMLCDLEANNYGFVAHDRGPRRIEDDYVAALIELRDRRIAKVLAQQANNVPAVWVRRKLAYAAHCLGDDTAWRSYAADAQTGKVKLPTNDRLPPWAREQPRVLELAGMIEFLALVRVPESDRALAAFTDRKHPYYAELAKELPDDGGWNRNGLFLHPYCLDILGQELDHAEPTGATWAIKGEKISWIDAAGEWRGQSSLPQCLRDLAVRQEKREERFHDLAAVRLGALVFGMPDYHPLLNDHDELFEQLRATYLRFRGRFRLLDEQETKSLDLHWRNPCYVPDMKPLDHPATSADVKAGRALFHLDGTEKLADQVLPATAILKGDTKQKEPQRVLIVQAETANGVTTYGVIAPHAILVLTADELDDIKPLAEEKADR